MVEIAIAVTAKVAELMVAPVMGPLFYLRNYQSNLERLKNGVEKLKDRIEMVEFAVDDAMRQGEEIKQNVQLWLNMAKEMIEMQLGVIDHYYERAEQRCCMGLCPSLKRRYKLSKRATRMLKDAVELQTKGDFDTVSYRLKTESTYSGGYVDFESRRSTLNGVLESLRNPDVGIVGVYGMGGVGKTTLVKEVARLAKKDKLFREVIFVEVSETPDIKKIQQVIANLLGLKFNEESESGRASRLLARLKKVTKVLLILDNLWGSLDLETIGIPVKNDHKGCKLLLTSRRIDVLSMEMNSQCNFPIDVLSEEEAWKLFSKIAGVCVEQPDLRPLAFEVVKTSGGLPIAIVTIAKALKNKNEFEWRTALLKLRSPVARSAENFEGFTNIRLGYDHLESDELKFTFLLCSMMENDAYIEDLIRYAMGLRLFPSSISKMEHAQNRAATLLQKLKDSSLLDVVDNERFSMLDLVRDVGRVIAFNEQHALIVRDGFFRWDWADEGIFSNCTAMSLHDIGVLPERLVCPQLEFFYLKTRDPFLEVPNDFFTGVPALRVLHFIGMGLLSLPTSLSLLTNLQTLCIDQCKLRDVAVVGELRELEILSFRSSDIEAIPGGIGELTGLRLLDLSHCSKLKVIEPNIISRLTQLEVLYMGNTPIQWEVEENTSLAELKHLSHLTTLEIHIRDAKLMPEDLFSQMLEKYKIVMGDDWGHWDRYKYDTARTLKFSAIDVERIWLPAMGSFVENLTCLVVQGCGKLRYLFSSSIVSRFVQLQYLEICECTVLEEMIVAESEEKDLKFPQLHHLKMNDLENLRIFYSGSNIEFPLLKELEIENCPGLEAFIFNDKVEIPGLEKMTISSMDNLKTIWDNLLVEGSFCKLRSLEVNDCQKLLTVFPSCICERLSMLESLTVKSCGLVERIFDLQELNFDEKYFTEAIQLTELYIDHMPNLKHIWNKDPQGRLSFAELQKVTVFLCPNLTNIFPPSVASSLLKLESLEVSDCGVEGIFAKGGEGEEEAVDRFLFLQLSSLQLHRLPELRTFYPGHIVEGPCLKSLGLHHCDKVKLSISEFLSFYETNEGQLDNPMQVTQPFFLVKKDLLNVEELQLSGKAITMNWHSQVPELLFGSLQILELNDDKSTVFPLNIIQRIYNLKQLSLNCSSYKEIFSYGDVEDRFPQIKHLVLSELCDLKQIWKQDSKVLLNFQNLEILEVRSCFNLINLMPSSASFQNLTILEVWGCEGLKNLFTFSTAKSLEQLEKLEVFDCKIMTEVVANEGAVAGEIIFKKLKSLSLLYLQSLASFCSVKHNLNCPVLGSLVVNECPKMKIFSEGLTSTPSLQKLELNWKAVEQSGEVDLNTTIQQNMEKRLLGREDRGDPSINQLD